MLSQRGMRWFRGNVTELGVRLNSDAGHQDCGGELLGCELGSRQQPLRSRTCMSLAGGV